MRAWSIAAATAAHAGAIALLLVIPMRSGSRVGASEREAELEIEPLIEAPTVGPTPEATATAQASSGAAHGPSSAPPATEGRAHEGAASSTEPAPPAASGAASAAPTAQIFAMSPADLGIGGTNPFLPRRDDAPSGDDKRSTVLRDSLRARDMALGLGPQGPVVEALRDAASSSIAPTNGKAVFEIHAGEGGVISLVDLVATEGGGWSDTQRVAKEKLASVKIVLPRGAKGAVLRVEVTSKWAYPNGQRVGESGWGTRSAAEMPNRQPAIVWPDPQNLVEKPRRVVSAHVVGGEIF